MLFGHYSRLADYGVITNWRSNRMESPCCLPLAGEILRVAMVYYYNVVLLGLYVHEYVTQTKLKQTVQITAEKENIKKGNKKKIVPAVLKLDDVISLTMVC